MLEDVSVASSPKRKTVPVDDRLVVAFFRNALLNFNEPFIRLQGERLTRYKSIYVGKRLVPNGIKLRADRTVIATRYTVALCQFRAAASSFPANSR
jgi:hypothetical protein